MRAQVVTTETQDVAILKERSPAQRFLRERKTSADHVVARVRTDGKLYAGTR